MLTHFDLPKKHGHRPPAPRREAEDAAIAAARESGCAVEISSAGLRKPVGEAYPEPRLLSAIVEAGIPVTFSSDAHAPAEVGWGYEKTLELARDGGRDRVRHVREAAEDAAPPPAVNHRPSSANTSADGRRRRANVA